MQAGGHEFDSRILHFKESGFIMNPDLFFLKNYGNLLKKKVYCDKISFVDKKSTKRIFLDSSMVEHTAVNRGVVGSSPTRGVYFFV